MSKKYVLVSSKVDEANDLVKSVNDLLEKGYELYGSPQISTGEVDTIYQAMTKE